MTEIRRGMVFRCVCKTYGSFYDKLVRVVSVPLDRPYALVYDTHRDRRYLKGLSKLEFDKTYKRVE